MIQETQSIHYSMSRPKSNLFLKLSLAKGIYKINLHNLNGDPKYPGIVQIKSKGKLVLRYIALIVPFHLSFISLMQLESCQSVCCSGNSFHISNLEVI